ncbi:hypothetical protein KXQ82_12600, partial [Mucilaginibacter sp. HMF5004]|uniref:hypothetical protein n=1 Tax=Mucilaginibacter rivuli TaxID=2857527 RepID=UPI001C5DED9B
YVESVNYSFYRYLSLVIFLSSLPCISIFIAMHHVTPFKELSRRRFTLWLYIYVSLSLNLNFHFSKLKIALSLYAFSRNLFLFSPSLKLLLFNFSTRSFWDCKGRNSFLVSKFYLKFFSEALNFLFLFKTFTKPVNELFRIAVEDKSLSLIAGCKGSEILRFCKSMSIKK